MAAIDDLVGQADGSAVEQFADGGVRSQLDELRAQRDREIEALDLKLEIPSWNGKLLAAYRVLGKKERHDLQRRARARGGSDDALTESRVDLLATACTGVFLRAEDGSLTRVSAGYDHELAAMVDQAGVSQGDLVRHMLGHNTIALDAHGERVAGWMTDPRPDAGDDQGPFV